MFKSVDRSQKDWLVVIGGWAFDSRVFASLDLPYNYLLFENDSSGNFQTQLRETLAENSIEKVSLLGWSQGAFTACDFACCNNEIIEDVILIGLRKKYQKQGLDNIKKLLAKNKKAYLYSFYKQCFCADERQSFRWFKDQLLKDYVANFSTEQLTHGLDQLLEGNIDIEKLEKLKSIKIVHGAEDAIAPIAESLEIANALANAKFIEFEKTGHLPFLRKDFCRKLYEN